jgi:hypothetical protein
MVPAEVPAVNVLTDDQWQKLVPKLREKCPRLTEQDLAEAKGRVDLTVAKIQNRHWCDRLTAQRTVFALLGELGLSAPAA